MTKFQKILQSLYNEMGKRGWDKTAKGWLNVYTKEILTLDQAATQEIDKESIK